MTEIRRQKKGRSMKILLIITLLLTLTGCRTVGFNSDNEHTNDYDAMGPDYDMRYPNKGESFEFGGSISTDAYLIHKKGKVQ